MFVLGIKWVPIVILVKLRLSTFNDPVVAFSAMILVELTLEVDMTQQQEQIIGPIKCVLTN
jgi:hypothetical protein